MRAVHVDRHRLPDGKLIERVSLYAQHCIVLERDLVVDDAAEEGGLDDPRRLVRRLGLGERLQAYVLRPDGDLHALAGGGGARIDLDGPGRSDADARAPTLGGHVDVG